MYPEQELIRLAGHKAALQRKIAIRRAQGAESLARLVQPVILVEQLLVLWRRFAPLAAVPLGYFVTRRIFPRRRNLGTFVRWIPLILGAVRVVGSAIRTQPRAPRLAPARPSRRH